MYEQERNHHLHHEFAFRNDIDGLRALAVLSVVLFHFFPEVLHGGYIGVDIFFVISGYLITTIIYAQLLTNSFSFLNFYSKRIKRIFPSLMLVLASSILFGFFALTDAEYKLLGKHILGGTTFLSNFVYWHESGYFDISAETKPLLHLWSLAIEEQFYIVWPFLLWVIHKTKNKILLVTVLLFSCSFVFNMMNINIDAIGTFYSPLTRCWELLAGSFVAYNYIQKNELVSNIIIKYSNIFAILGFLLILYALFFFSRETIFPSWRALFPVVGACLVILSTSESLINKKLLSSEILVWVGLISYPLYLWHWPILFFLNTTNFRFFDGLNGEVFTKLSFIMVAIFLSYLTYKFIEIPIRFKIKGNIISLFLLLLLAGIGMTGYTLYKTNGISLYGLTRHKAYSPEVKKIIEASKFRGYPIPPLAYCDAEYGCEYQALGTSNTYKILLLGDSHALQYWNTFARITKDLPENSYKILLHHNNDLVPQLSDKIINDTTIKTVVFSYYWALRYGSSKVNQKIRCCGNGKGGIVGSITQPILNTEEQDKLDHQMINLVTKLKNNQKRVYFILDNPFGEELDAHSMVDRRTFSIKYKKPKILLKSAALERTQTIRNRIINIANITHTSVIDPFLFLCNANICPALDENGELLYKDYDHISYYASIEVVKYLDMLLPFNQ